jgi:tail-collar fiber protein
MSEYFAILTNSGLAAVAAAVAAGTDVDLTEFAVGDGNGNPVTPLATMTELTNELHRDNLLTVAVDPDNANQLICTGNIAAADGGWTVREVGIFTAAGDLFAIANFPATYKPTVAEGSAADLLVRLVLPVANASVVNLAIDPSILLATQDFVNDAISAIPRVGIEEIAFTDTKPANTVWIDGSELPVDADYDALHAHYNGIYGIGPNGRSYLPEPQGLVLRVQDQSKAVDPDAATRTDRGDGTTGDNVGTTQDSANLAHDHNAGIGSIHSTVGIYGSTTDDTPGAATDRLTISTNTPTVQHLTSSEGGSESRGKNIYIRMYVYYK